MHQIRSYRDDLGIGRAPGVVDRVFAIYAGSQGFDSSQLHMLDDFSNPKDQVNGTQSALSWKNKVVSEWGMVIAVSLNIDGGVKQAKLYMCMQNIGETHSTRCVWS